MILVRKWSPWWSRPHTTQNASWVRRGCKNRHTDPHANAPTDQRTIFSTELYRTIGRPLFTAVRTINGNTTAATTPKRNTYRYTNPDTPIFIQRAHGLGEGPPSPHVSSWLRGRSAPGLHLLRRCGAPHVTSVSGFTSYRVSGGSRRRLTPDPTCRRAAPCSRPCPPRLQTARPQPWPASSVWWG